MSALVAVAVAGCGGAGPRTLHGKGFSFRYPASWRHVTARFPSARVLHDPQPARNAVGVDRSDLVTATTSPEPVLIDRGNIADLLPAAGRRLAGLAAANGGRMLQAPAVLSVAGLPAYTVETQTHNAFGVAIDERVIAIYRPHTLYVISCQHRITRDEGITAGCRQALDSFTPGR